jgi:AAHS family 4-hydroxybenzoate transporter-like MFS transporter
MSELSSARRTFALALIAVALICEGFDVSAASFAAPDIAHDFGIATPGLGYFLTANSFGMLFGSAFVGGIGDRIGRRPLVIGSTFGYSALMLLATLATGLWQLTVARFAMGICVGALLPNAIVLAGELVSERHRTRTSAAVTLGISLGATLAGLGAAIILPAYGWRGFYLIGGAIPFLFSIVMRAALPESPHFVRHARGQAPPRPRLVSLFRDGLGPMTIAIWTLIVLLSMSLYLLSAWTPVLLRESGLDVRSASLAGSLYSFGGLVGGVVAALLLGRSRWPTLAGFLALAAVAVFLASRVEGPLLLIGLALAGAGALVTGSQAAFNGLGASAYPLGLRAAGFGGALAVARIGSVGGPMVGAWFVAAGVKDAQSLFAVPIVPLLIASGCAVWLARRARRVGPSAGQS